MGVVAYLTLESGELVDLESHENGRVTIRMGKSTDPGERALILECGLIEAGELARALTDLVAATRTTLLADITHFEWFVRNGRAVQKRVDELTAVFEPSAQAGLREIATGDAGVPTIPLTTHEVTDLALSGVAFTRDGKYKLTDPEGRLRPLEDFWKKTGQLRTLTDDEAENDEAETD